VVHRFERRIVLETIFTLQTHIEDIDQLGHVNNCRYVKFLEDARVDWYGKCGITLHDFKEMGMGTVVLKMEVLYLKEAKLGDHLKIITTPEYLGKTSFVLKQDIYNQFDEHISDAKVTMVMFDTVLRKGIRVINQIAQYFR
jgi:YbgC/YbaW family acyl-CoA thioester hydrolase